MDNFMDKIAQKLSAQEVIRANSAADTAQMDKLQVQVTEYDACMKEMRKLNLKNAENEQKIQDMLESSSVQMQELFQKNSGEMRRLTEECIAKLQATDSQEEKDAEVETILGEVKKAVDDYMIKAEELFRQSDDFVHKENVKVYRNVQAVIVEELEKQTQTLVSLEQTAAAKGKKVFVFSIITLAAAFINMGLLIVHLLGGF